MSQTVNLEQMGRTARSARRALATLRTDEKNEVLLALAAALEDPAAQTGILAANALDVSAARETGLEEALIERLTLTPARLGQSQYSSSVPATS